MLSSDATLKNCRYVRVQDDLHGMETNSAGELLVVYKKESARNTIHFAINGIVEDHAYGTFNQHPDGSLKGKIVIIANPAEMGVPSGFNQVDTWFRMGAQEQDNGTLRRQLNAGHATIVVPVGTEIPVGANAMFYDGTIAGRDAAVAKTLADNNIVQRNIRFRNWGGVNERDAELWAEEAAAQLYPDNVRHIHIGMHNSSPDADMDTIGVGNQVKLFAETGKTTYRDDEGIDQSFMLDIEGRVQRHHERINVFLSNLSPEERTRCGAFYEGLDDKLSTDLLKARDISVIAVANQDKRSLLYGAIEDQFFALAPHREIYIANKDGSRMDNVSPAELTDRLVDRLVQADSQVWIHGQSANWQPITAALVRDVFFQSLGLPPPLPPNIEKKETLETIQSMAQQAQEAWQDLSWAIDENMNVGGLGEMFGTAVEKTVASFQGSGEGASDEKWKKLVHFGDTIQSLAVMDGDMITLAKVDTIRAYSQCVLDPQYRSTMAESTPDFSV